MVVKNNRLLFHHIRGMVLCQFFFIHKAVLQLSAADIKNIAFSYLSYTQTASTLFTKELTLLIPGLTG